MTGASPTPAAGRLGRFCRGREVGLAYGAIVLGVCLALQLVSPATRERLVLAVSTDPARLLDNPLRSLLVSPFVVPAVLGLWLVPLAVLAVGGVQRSFGPRTAVLTGLLSHLAVSVAVAVVLERADDPPVTVALADVGVSYVLAASAGLCLLRVPSGWTGAYAGGGTAFLAAVLAGRSSSTDAGHLLAWLVGLGLSGLLRPHPRLTDASGR